MVSLPSHLIKKYSTNGPRYTSYPSALSFSSEVSAEDWNERFLDFRRHHPRVSLYVHIPFCPSLCFFCACNKVVTKRKDVIEEHLHHLIEEILTAGRSYGDSVDVCQLHWGGGSPSYLSSEQFERVYSAVRTAFPRFEEHAEVSVEVDPRTTTEAKLRTYKRLGVTRLSLGVQDFDPNVQALVHREQPFDMTASLLMHAREIGFSGINTDLIYGLPGQTLESFHNTVCQLITVNPDRIALYGYAHVPWIKRAQKVFDEAGRPSPLDRIALFNIALERLVQNGYQHIGLDHFARPHDELYLALQNGTLKRNFMGFTVQPSEAIIAFGMSAISSLPDIMVQNARELPLYNQAIERTHHAIQRGYIRSKDDQIRGAVIHEILCTGRVMTEEIAMRWNIDFWGYFNTVSDHLIGFEEDGLLEWCDKEILLSPRGKLLARNIAMAFDAHIAAPLASSTVPTFSQTI